MLGYEFPIAGLAPWLCLKADAIMRRDKPKDAYDVVWLLDALGPVPRYGCRRSGDVCQFPRRGQRGR